MSKTVIAVLYLKGEDLMNNLILDWSALDDMLDKDLYVPVKHGTDRIGTCTRLTKSGDRILATIELVGEIGCLLQQKGKRSVSGKVIVTDAELNEIYI
jgi:hypothetical protein